MLRVGVSSLQLGRGYRRDLPGEGLVTLPRLVTCQDKGGGGALLLTRLYSLSQNPFSYPTLLLKVTYSVTQRRYALCHLKAKNDISKRRVPVKLQKCRNLLKAIGTTMNYFFPNVTN